MDIFDIFKPLMPILQKAVKIEYDKKAVAELVLYLLGPEEKDDETAKMLDAVIKGGEVVEVVDGPIAKAEIKNLRDWANKARSDVR